MGESPFRLPPSGDLVATLGENCVDVDVVLDDCVGAVVDSQTEMSQYLYLGSCFSLGGLPPLKESSQLRSSYPSWLKIKRTCN